MEKGYIHRQIRRISRNFIIVNIIIFILVCIGLHSQIVKIIEIKEITGSISPSVLKVFGVSPFGIIVVLIVAGINIWNIIKGVKSFINPTNHKIYKNLINSYYPIDVIEAIDDEASSNAVEKLDKLTVLPSWWIGQNFFTITVVKVNDILWVYKKVTKNSINLIPMGKTFDLVIGLSNRHIKIISMKEKNIDKVLNYIKDRYPWIITGYSEELKATWDRRFGEFSSYVNNKKH